MVALLCSHICSFSRGNATPRGLDCIIPRILYFTRIIYNRNVQVVLSMAIASRHSPFTRVRGLVTPTSRELMWFDVTWCGWGLNVESGPGVGRVMSALGLVRGPRAPIYF